MNIALPTTNISDIKSAERHRQEIDRILSDYPLSELAGSRILLSHTPGFVDYWLLTALDTLNRRGAAIQVGILTSDTKHFYIANPELETANWLTLLSETETHSPAAGDRFDYFIHNVHDNFTIASPLARLQNLSKCSRNLFDHAVRAGVLRILFVGDSDIYRNVSETLDRILEDSVPAIFSMSAHDANSEGLRFVEALGACYSQEYGIDFLSARCFPFFGAGLPERMALQQFVQDALYADEVYVLGDGEPVRSYLYGADLAVWLLSLLIRGKPSTAYNVGSEMGYRMADLAEEVVRTLSPGKRVNILNVYPPPPAPRLIPDVSRIRRDTGVKEWTSLAQGILSMAEYKKIHV